MRINKTFIFFGAGATARLGLPTTDFQNNFFKSLFNEGSIKERITSYARNQYPNTYKEFIKDVELTLSILFDGNSAKNEVEARKERNKAIDEFIKQNSSNEEESKKLEHYLRIHIFPYYDWLALKSIAKEMLSLSDRDSLDLQDLLTVISNSLNENISIPTAEIFSEEKEYTTYTKKYINSTQRLIGAINVYKLLVFKLFKYAFKEMEYKNKLLNYYKNFARDIINIGTLNAFENQDLVSDLYLSTLNWDPILPFFFIKEAKIKNDKILSKNQRIYLSYGAPFSVFNIRKLKSSGYIIDEDSAFFSRIMTLEKRKCNLITKIIKFFIPHGLFNLRVCPRCKNAFFIFPDRVGKIDEIKLQDIFLFDPLPFNEERRKLAKLNHSYKYTLPSEIECPYCKTSTFFENTFMQIQTIFKPEFPPPMKKMYLDYGISFSDAQHLIFIGYSFPKDDISHLMTLLMMSLGSNKERKLSLVIYNRNLQSKVWYSFDEANHLLEKHKDKRDLETLENASKLFKQKNIRISFLGFPNILKVIKTKELINW